MEYKCNSCGNVFDDSLGCCPGCGAPVVKVETEQQSYQQGYQQQNYQQGYQQQNYQQPNYQQPNYQQGYQQYPTYGGAPIEQKSRIAAGLLGIFLGAFGVHNFYLGYTNKALAQLLMTLLSCGCLGAVSEIWGFIEGILILVGNINTDANGVPLGD